MPWTGGEVVTDLQQAAVICGAVVGAGLLLVVRALWSRTPHLVTTAETLAGGDAAAATVSPATGRGLPLRVGIAVLRRWPTVPGARVPHQDLRCLGCRSPGMWASGSGSMGDSQRLGHARHSPRSAVSSRRAHGSHERIPPRGLTL
jgi:hypothetical protein